MSAELYRARKHLVTQRAILATVRKNIAMSNEVHLLAVDQVMAAEAWVREAEWRATEGKAA